MKKTLLTASALSCLVLIAASTAAGEAGSAEPGDVRAVPGLAEARVAWVPPGSFRMGSPADEPGRESFEPVAVEARISRGFWMWQTEVTQRQFKEVMGFNPARFPDCGPDCPVEWVNSLEAAAFCNALSRRHGLVECYECFESEDSVHCTLKPEFARRGDDGYAACPGWRLPTEKEWEYAARAGTDTALPTGPIALLGHRVAPALDPLAVYGGNCGVDYPGAYGTERWTEMQTPATRCGTQPVARRQPNAWNLYDMLGNVAEWCADWWSEEPPAVARVSEEDATQANWRVTRGGSWFDLARYVRVAARSCFDSGNRFPSIGFRVVRTEP